MERLLKPEKLDCDPAVSTEAQEWKHWFGTFENFLGALPQENVDMLDLIMNFVSPKIYETIPERATYDSAINALKSHYVKSTNEVFAHHRLVIRRQQVAESLNEYIQVLETMSKDCNFRTVKLFNIV